ncbi:hypothetical protein E2C01_030296 [Portunus trituberculatus]|uniref:Uncharacterized protein n=1 Tax=Portunus trituberculatus TaxID=210409 RepID=A0A5B7EUZ4_PORTR|nr:hypothetical protein [Portunus trituberculatus]
MSVHRAGSGHNSRTRTTTELRNNRGEAGLGRVENFTSPAAGHREAHACIYVFMDASSSSTIDVHGSFYVHHPHVQPVPARVLLVDVPETGSSRPRRGDSRFPRRVKDVPPPRPQRT